MKTKYQIKTQTVWEIEAKDQQDAERIVQLELRALDQRSAAYTIVKSIKHKVKSIAWKGTVKK